MKRAGILILALSSCSVQNPVPSKDVYLSSVAPILERACVECHGAKKAKGDLRLDSWQALLAGGKNPPLFVFGHSRDSLIIQRLLTSDEGEVMPPISEGEPLTSDEVETLRRWIDNQL
jgi:hypothetical protein